jgi:hypothetical protein
MAKRAMVRHSAEQASAEANAGRAAPQPTASSQWPRRATQNDGYPPNEALHFEAELASLLADRDALDAKREALNAEIAAVREALRIDRLKQKQPAPAPSAIQRSHQRLVQVREWVEAGESANTIAQRLTVGVERARVLMRQAKALAVQPSAPTAPPRCNRDQWVESFEGQLAILRPHLTPRILGTISLRVWHQHGTKGEDPIKTAKDWAASLQKPGVIKAPRADR